MVCSCGDHGVQARHWAVLDHEELLSLCISVSAFAPLALRSLETALSLLVDLLLSLFTGLPSTSDHTVLCGCLPAHDFLSPQFLVSGF